MNRFLVTGGAGFLGSHVVRALVEQGHAVRVLDNLSQGTNDSPSELDDISQGTAALPPELGYFSQGTDALAPVLDDIELVKGDVRNAGDISAALKDIDIVIHLAAYRTVKSSENPLLAHDVNTTATLALLEQSRLTGVERFVYASTAAVYGDSAIYPQRETEPLNPRSPYAISKLAAEGYCDLFARNTELETVSLRYFNIYGPGQNPLSRYSGVSTAFMSSLRDGRPCQIFGDGRQARDFIYIDDAVEATVAAIKQPGVNGKVINVGSGNCHTIIDLAQTISVLMGVELEPVHLPQRPMHLDRLHADIGLMRELLGVEPQVGFNEGLEKTVAWFLQKV